MVQVLYQAERLADTCQTNAPRTWILLDQKELRIIESLSDQDIRLSATINKVKDLTISRLVAWIG
jgi:hypothetical protein